MTATYLWINGGSEEPGSEGTFDDVDASADYAKSSRMGWQKTVLPTVHLIQIFTCRYFCSRGQIVTFLDRAFN